MFGGRVDLIDPGMMKSSAVGLVGAVFVSPGIILGSPGIILGSADIVLGSADIVLGPPGIVIGSAGIVDLCSRADVLYLSSAAADAFGVVFLGVPDVYLWLSSVLVTLVFNCGGRVAA